MSSICALPTGDSGPAEPDYVIKCAAMCKCHTVCQKGFALDLMVFRIFQYQQLRYHVNTCIHGLSAAVFFQLFLNKKPVTREQQRRSRQKNTIIGFYSAPFTTESIRRGFIRSPPKRS